MLLTCDFSTVMLSTLRKLNVRSFSPLRSTMKMAASGPNLTVTKRLWFAWSHSLARILSTDCLLAPACLRVSCETKWSSHHNFSVQHFQIPV